MGKLTTVSLSRDTSCPRPGLRQYMQRAAVALATLFVAAAPAAAQQQGPAIVNPGNAVVTGFSGTVPNQAPDGSDPFDYLSIDLNGPAARVLDLTTLGAQGQESQVAKPYTVTAAQVGQVFGVALDNAAQPNIYLAATSAYGISIYVPDQSGAIKRIHTGAQGAQFLPGQFGPPEQGGGPGSIWRVDGVTGEVTLFSTIDSAAQGVASLGGLAFDPRTQQLFVADRGTGLIHRLSLDGTDRGTFDHGADGRPRAGLAPVPLDAAPTIDINNPAFDTETPSTWGLAAPPRRVFGLAVWQERLYYSALSQVWSVAIGEDGAFTSDVHFEADVPALQDGMEIASITFDGQKRMYLAERGSPTGDYSLTNLASEGASRVLRFSQKPAGDGSPGFWKLTPEQYAIGYPPNYNNGNGGVALGYGYQQGGSLNIGACKATVWSTGERLLDPGDPNAAPDSYPALDGLQGNSSNLVEPQNEPPTQAWFVGYYDQPGTPLFRGHMGAIAILSPCGEQVTYVQPPPQPPVLRCPQGTDYVNGQCVVTVSCPRGLVYRNGYCINQSCPPGYVRYRNQCVPPPQTCPPGTTFYEGECVPVGCPPGMRQLSNGYCSCQPGLVYYNGRCVPPNSCPPGMVTLPSGLCWCPVDSYFVGGRCIPNYCPPGYFRQGGECLPKWCQPGYTRGDDGFCHPVFNPCPPNQRPFQNYCVPKFCPQGTYRGNDGYCYGAGNTCGPGQEFYAGGCVTACLPLFKRNNIGICISIGDFYKKEPFCKGGKVRVGNACVCPPNKFEVNGVCVPGKPGPGQLLCTKNHILKGNQCVCPVGYTENNNGVCVQIQQGAACGKGHIRVNNVCVCPPNQNDNNPNGACVANGPAPIQVSCTKGHMRVGNACVCPPNQNDNTPNGICVPNKGPAPAAPPAACTGGKVKVNNQCVCPGGTDENANGQCVISCRGGKVRQGNQCVCPPGTTENAQRVCVAGAKPAACTGGKVLVNNVCRCPANTQDNGQGVCVAAGPKKEKPAPVVCTGGKVLVNNACRCPQGTQDNGQGTCVAKAPPPKAPPPQKIVCTGGKILQGGQCVCGPNKVDNGNGVCVPKGAAGGGGGGGGAGGAKPAGGAGGAKPMQCPPGKIPGPGRCICAPGTKAAPNIPDKCVKA